MPRTHPEAQQRQWSCYLQEDCSCGYFSSSHQCADPPYRLALSPGWHRHTCRNQAECLFFPAATELTRSHWQSAATEDTLMQLTMPSRKSPAGKGKRKQCDFSLLTLGGRSPQASFLGILFCTKSPTMGGLYHITTYFPPLLYRFTGVCIKPGISDA